MPKTVTLCLLFILGASPVATLQEVAGEWRRASPERTLTFPRDHASHPDYRIEWWYYTGNVETTVGRSFGYQVTFFRVGIDRVPSNPSRWAVRDLFMAHLALTDLETGRHFVDERLNRAGVGWAGARTNRLDVWNEDWRLAGVEDTHLLEAVSEDLRFGIDLSLSANQAPVLHGVDGFSQKGVEVGNASHYYSLTRMDTTGQIRLDGEVFDVHGLSWMDHEFGTTFLEPSQQGWDWFSLQLDDGTDIMVYVLRRQDGTQDPHSGGTVIMSGGTVVRLTSGDQRLIPGRIWVSPRSGARYPVEWSLEIPAVDLELHVRAAVDGQELHTAESTGVTYWEGAVEVSGTRADQPVTGRGYLEMTGYSGRPMSEVLR